MLRALKEGRVSGAILFRENLNTRAGLRKLTGGMRRAAGGPVLVCVDQEGGGVRVIPWIGPGRTAPAQASSNTVGSDARAAGAQLRADGVTVTLAPVADLPTIDGAAVGGRTFGREPARVQQAVAAAVKGWRAGGVAPTLKHFPGFGGAKTNTDDAPATIDRSAAQLHAVDLPPFKAGIAAGAPIVMLSHARYPALDKSRIASQSPAVLRLLRDELEFDGVAMTDSLEAAAVTAEPGGVGTAAIRSVEAGVDSILTPAAAPPSASTGRCSPARNEAPRSGAASPSRPPASRRCWRGSVRASDHRVHPTAAAGAGALRLHGGPVPDGRPGPPARAAALVHGRPAGDLRLGEEPLALTRRAVRRSLAKAGNDWELRVCRASDRVIAACAQPRPRDGVWLTPRLCSLYRALDGAGALRTFELWVDGRLAAGIVGVGVGRAVMLESMFHTVPDSGNVLIYRTLEHLHASGYELCDVQMATDHTRRLGVIEISAVEYSARLAHALEAR